VKAALTPVVLAVLLGLTACGGGGGSPPQAVTNGPIGRGAKRVWIFRPAGKPKRLVIFFHGQGGPVELTPANHRPWIDHLVARGAAVIYPQYETAAEAGVMGQAVAGIRSATKALGLESVPVVALGYSRGGALAIEYAAVAPARHVPVPKVVESVNPVAFGEEADVVNLKTLRPRTVLAVLVSDKDPAAAESTGLLFKRLQEAGFPETQIKTRVARSHGTFTADHLAPLGTSPAARAAYWVPTDSLLSSLASG
jgi:poly(3-hydroxybutyrate) depolymerase